jgi:hypothetical protein
MDYSDVVDEALYLNVSAPREPGDKSAGVTPFEDLLKLPSVGMK